MNNTIKFSVNTKNSGKRLDIFLTENINDFTRSYLKKLITDKQVKINGSVNVLPSAKVKYNDQISINLIEKNIQTIAPKKIKLEIIYEDKDIMVINKPKGMVVHPGAGNYDNTLVNALLFKYKKTLSDLNGKLRPGIVHRIDKETSGLLVVAKNNFAHAHLGSQFSNHSIRRKYICLSWGVVRPLDGKIITLIKRDQKNRKLMTVSDISGKKAITNYKTLKVFNIKDIPKISLIECELETGRTHQIRVHMKHIGHTLFNDNRYGGDKILKGTVYTKYKQFVDNCFKLLPRQALHAKTLGFIHPKSNKKISFDSEIPDDMNSVINKWRLYSKHKNL